MKQGPQTLRSSMPVRLAERVRQSAAAHREFTTVRREDLAWQTVAPGCEEALLVATAYTRVVLVKLAPGAALHWPGDARAQELLLLQGELSVQSPVQSQARSQVHSQAQPAAADGPRPLAPHSYALRSAAEAGSLRAVNGPAQLYVRHLVADVHTLPEPERGWWQMRRAPLQLVPAGARRWWPNFPGVQVMPLWGSAGITSMLVRFEPGASVPDHRHAVHEDCLMMEGEMFLGDILLRAGDFQLAPAGGGHFGEMSDVGGTFFFHGAIDPVLVPPSA